MNKIFITNRQDQQTDESTLLLTYAEANKLLPVLRSDHFKSITLANSTQLLAKDLKFLIQFTRLLKSDGEVVLDSAENQQLNTILKTLHLFQAEGLAKRFLKSKPEAKAEIKEEKLAIGFHASELEEEIDENALLEGENIQIAKKKAENCDTKPRACANCSCGRKDTVTTVSKEELVKSVNEGNPVSGCGKCFLGDSFRCGTCPYKGLPAFKPGDKLKLEQDGGVQVQSASTFVSASGKVKLQL